MASSKLRGEVAATHFLENGSTCLHDIPADARQCRCGARVAMVVVPLQLAFFECKRKYNPNQPRMSRIANDGVV